ncbi:regulatory particle non-ATPase [Collariella sp. IMI 366227]|nr:regulatory particle non-ATPase [Collariella sp. IMI 366227]
MADRDLTTLLTHLKSTPPPSYPEATALLSRAKLLLLQLSALTPSPTTPPAHLALARSNADAFTRYVAQLRPFYELQDNSVVEGGERNKITGLYLLLLLTQGLRLWQILTSQIRSEIASSSERAYPSLPLASTKSLLFLDSEGAVVDFARSRGWTVKDGHIFFPSAQETGEEEQEQELSQMIIENALGYARQLETIV